MAAMVKNFTIERGIQFSRTVTITNLDGSPVDFTGVVFLADIRLSRLPTDIRSFPTGTGPLQTAAFAVSVDSGPGVLLIALTADQTNLLERGYYDYDVVLTFPSGDKRRIIKGILVVVEITSVGDGLAGLPQFGPVTLLQEFSSEDGHPSEIILSASGGMDGLLVITANGDEPTLPPLGSAFVSYNAQNAPLSGLPIGTVVRARSWHSGFRPSDIFEMTVQEYQGP